jgi:hypothetical protein
MKGILTEVDELLRSHYSQPISLGEQSNQSTPRTSGIDGERIIDRDR